jgi:hypothetical protein
MGQLPEQLVNISFCFPNREMRTIPVPTAVHDDDDDDDDAAADRGTASHKRGHPV